MVMSSIHLSLKCFYYRLEEETLHIKYKEKVSYREAKEKPTDKFIIIIYSSITRPHNEIQLISCANIITQPQVSSGKSTVNNTENTSKQQATTVPVILAATNQQT